MSVPVSGALNDYGDHQDKGEGNFIHARPRNFAFSAYPVLLLSHLRYLTYKPTEKDLNRSRLVNRLADWFLTGGAFPAPPAAGDALWQEGSLRHRRYAAHFLQWAIVGAVLACLLGWIVSGLAPSTYEYLAQIIGWPWTDPNGTGGWFWNALAQAWVGLVVATTLVVISGALRAFGIHRLRR